MKTLKPILAVVIMILGSTITLAQPFAVKNAAKSVFSLTTFRADGSLLASSHGVFVGDNGEGISDLKPFLGAASAVVIDASGKRLNVTRILGINDIYDVARFKVDGKTIPATIATAPTPTGGQAWLVCYGVDKRDYVEATVKSTETFMDKYTYYIFGMNAPDNGIACPYINAKGEVMGLLQISNTSFNTHATDARFIHSLSLNGLSFNDSNIRQIGIPMAMPTDFAQAQLTLMMAGQAGDSLKYDAAITDFTQIFPQEIDGYEARARLQMEANQFEAADNTMQTALKNVEKKVDAHFSYSKLIYDKEVYRQQMPFEKWSLDKAIEEARAAYQLSPQPAYKQLEAQIMFTQGKYQEAYDLFNTLYQNPNYKNAELLYSQARCKEMMNVPATEVIALLDSAINTTDSLRIREAAPYFLERANMYMTTDSFRQAAFDYTRYEYLVQGNVNAHFYYLREQAEVKGRLFQQALNDIARAILLAPNEPTYLAEMASLQLRVNKAEQAIKTAERCTEIAPEYGDGFLLLGLAQVRTGQKAAGLANMQKAKDLGNEQAQSLIDKYSK